ncbi:MAG: periplasmic beta-glucosidase [Chitinophagaceae bacterium]|nr:periplasmic beta-glucosidase [Chitinophagaceae bacterium]
MKKTLLYFLSLCFVASATCQDRAVASSNLSDNDLLNIVQKQTFKYFWDFGHPVSGLARERSDGQTHKFGDEVVTSGGSGFGIMAIIVAADRKWITRKDAVTRLLKITSFLDTTDRFHGAFSHWINGTTGKVIPFSAKDNGGDIVETSFLFEGLLCARQYFNKNSSAEKQLRKQINNLWNDVDWNWYTQGQNVLYWHWSPDNGWAMNHQIHGWNECLVTYVLAASSPTHAVAPAVYHEGYAQGKTFVNGKTYYDIKLTLGNEYGGPLFFTHYSFMGLDPRHLSDKYADYWQQNVNHTLINRAYCIDNPKKYKGYGENSWGLTASYSIKGYAAHSPTRDLGVISPTAALSAFPYTPKYSMQMLRHLYNNKKDQLWGEYGFGDAYDETENWYNKNYLAIDQGPIVVMIENYRTGLLWKLFMSCPEIKAGLDKLGFTKEKK